MADEKHEESFKVIDRRPFTAEGEPRKEFIEQERREQEAAAAVPKPGATSRGPSPDGGRASGAFAPAPNSPAQAGTSQADKGPEAAQPSRNFQLLVDFLARNAALLLGGYADPRTGQALLDLEGAHEMIDMLDALTEKTRGNLAPEDERLLLEVIGSLKLTYLEMSKHAAQAMKEKAKARS